MSEELKPCPFCGASVHRVEREFQHNGCTGYEDIIRCSSCALVCEDMHGDAWNNRHTPEGYALVPVEPTEEMLAAWFGAEQVKNTQNACIMFGDKYKAMIAAATETNLACDLCEGSGKKVVGPDQDGRKYKVDCDCTKP